MCAAITFSSAVYMKSSALATNTMDTCKRPILTL